HLYLIISYLNSVTHYHIISDIYTLSLHDALPISLMGRMDLLFCFAASFSRFSMFLAMATIVTSGSSASLFTTSNPIPLEAPVIRSEEHTSELQSRGHLVCRLLLEKKKIIML